MTNERPHAVLSPSSASRWLACTPSARLEEQFPKTSSDASAEGTTAHALGEIMLRKFFGQISPSDYDAEFTKIKSSKFYNLEMLRHAEGYRDFVIEAYNDALMRSTDALIFFEQRLDMTDYVPEGFGTGDTVIVADRVLELIDLKYGKGHLVKVAENKQLMLYGLGAYKRYSVIYDIDTVKLTIYQPRIDNIGSWEISVKDLLKWAEEELKPKAKMAWEGVGELNVGAHCQFCAAKVRCRALAEHNLALARNEFRQADLLTNDEIVEVLEKLETLTSWAKAVSDYALKEAINGVKWPGFKLVEGRSVRKITDETAATQVLLSNGFQEDEIINKKMKGITDLEKLLGKRQFSELLGPYVVKPQGAPTLVPVTDKRPEFRSAEADFVEVAQIFFQKK